MLLFHFLGRDTRADQAEILFREAQTLIGQGNLYEAENKLDQATQLAPGEVRYHSALAEVLKSEGDYSGAMKKYMRVAEIMRDDPKPLLEAGGLALKNGERRRAEEIYTEAISRSPNDQVALYQLGFFAMTHGRFDEAVHYYRRILRNSPSEPQAWRNLGFIYTQRDQLEAAEEAYRKALELTPEDPELNNDLGNLMVIRKKFDEARRFFSRALEIKPDYRDARANLEALEGSTAEAAPPPVSPAPADGSSA